MAKKSTAQGIGYIPNADALGELTRQLIAFLNASANTDNSLGEEFINKLKAYVDAYVGRSRTNFTKTDVYQVLYLLLYSPIVRVTGEQNRVFKDTMVNTVVAKLVTEGQYGNPSVVRRQTTEDKIREMLMRTIGYQPSMLQNSNKLISRFGLNASQDEFPILMRVARKFLQRGTRSTTTTRRSNRTRRTTTPRSTTPAAPAPSQVTQTTRQVTPYQVTDFGNINELRVGIRESIKRFGETNDAKLKLQLMANAWHFRALFEMNVTREGNLTRADLKDITIGVFTRIGDVYNPANETIKYKQAIKYLKYVSYLLASGKINVAKSLMGSNIFIGETRATLSRQIFAIGIGRTSGAVFQNFINFMGGDARIYTAITRTFTGGPEVTRSMFATYLRSRASAPEIQQTQAISTSRLESNSTPTQAEVRATPDSSVTELVKEAKFKNTLGIEIEYQEVTFGEMKEGLKKAKIDLYPRYLGYHESVIYDKYKQWRIMHDGSLKDRFGRAYSKNIYNSRGREEVNIPFGELVSPILVGEKGLLQLIRVLNTMTKLGATNNQSNWLHIHLGIKDENQPFGISYKGLRNFIVNYIGFEKIIDAYTRKSRRQNNHSQYTPSPIVDIWRNKALGNGRIADVTYSELEELSRKLNAFDDAEFRQWAVRTLQRGKLNPHSNNLKFSFEIRQHGGTIERDTIMAWVLFMHYLCVFSEKKISTRFTWKNLSENILPKPLASFWQNRIADMSGEALDWKYDSWKTFPDVFNGPVKR